MKIKIIIGFIVSTILLTGCGGKHVTSAGSVCPSSGYVPPAAQKPLPVETVFKQALNDSKVIAFASVDTNASPMLMTVTEILKGPNVASTIGITNGIQFPYEWPPKAKNLPEGAVLFFARTDMPPATTNYPQSMFFLNAGRVLGMTIQDLKTNF